MILSQLFYVLGWMLIILAGAHTPALIAAAALNEAAGMTAMIVSFAFSAFAGIALILSFRGTPLTNDRRLTLATPLAGFSILPAFGAIPFAVSGAIPGVLDAYFEALSGLTTTGATVISSIADAPKSILLWRATLNWVGGFGTIVIGVAILPIIGIGAMHLVQSKLPRGEGWHLFERMRGAATTLLLTYVILSAMCFVLLTLVGNVPGFEAFCIALSTLSTGGFSPVDGPIGSIGGAGAEPVLILFMLAGAFNIVLFWRLFRGKGISLLKASENRYFVMLVCIGFLLLLIAGLVNAGQSEDAAGFGAIVSQSLFAAVSAATTTGFAPAGGQTLGLMAGVALLGLIFVGGTAGSTSGGLKVMRLLILARHSNRELDRLAHPHSASRVRFAEQRVGERDLTAVWNMMLSLLLMSVAGTLVLAAFNVSFHSAIAGAIAAISNAGPAAFMIDADFPGYADLETVPKLFLIVLMLVGRLEATMLLAMLSVAFWRR